VTGAGGRHGRADSGAGEGGQHGGEGGRGPPPGGGGGGGEVRRGDRVGGRRDASA
jgi:hypothetical protein